MLDFDDFDINIEICLQRGADGFHIDSTLSDRSTFYVRTICQRNYIIGDGHMSMCFDAYEDCGNHINFYKQGTLMGIISKANLRVREVEE